MYLASFILLGFICWRAVEVANHSADEARQDLSVANERADAIQDQLNCTINILSIALRGVLDNSIIQDDLLLSATEGNERAKVAADLKTTRDALVKVSEEISRIDKECTK
jgi:hypothetical protein